jgi:DNA-binding response OmpR family regulator
MNISEHSILLVDDDSDEVFLVERAVHKAGLRVALHVARDGQEAIDYLSQRDDATGLAAHPMPSMMLLDLKMPRKNGFEVLEWLQHKRGSERPIVVVLTSSSLIDDINRAYELGANSYLVKPGDFKTLVDIVKLLASYWLGLNQKPEAQDRPNEATMISEAESKAA